MITRTTITVDDIDITYAKWGSGDPIFMIMGYAGCIEIWEPKLIEKLAENHTVIAFDNRGMGFSTMGTKEYTFPQLADDLASFMDVLGIEKAGIFGYSMGTYIAQEFAVRHPDKTSRLMLYAADCGGREAVLCTPEVREALSNPPEDVNDAERMFIEHLFPAEWLEKNPNPQIYDPERPIPKSENIREQYIAWTKWQGVYSSLSKLEMPVLLFTGSEDIMIPPVNSYMIGQQVKNSWVVKIQGAGHGAMYQEPEYIASIVRAFMNS
ncbi:MAG: alpha/beta hydrolase [Firmicutes bacterium]|nr:alpha/beta hydrolase [Bacillota bacterium]